MTAHRDPQIRDRQPRPAFTLLELLIVIMIIALLTSMVMFALAGAQEEAQKRRTQAQIARLHELIMERYESYQTRRVVLPNRVPNRLEAARLRLNVIRELMRLEMPDRRTDVWDEPVVVSHRTSLSLAYQRRAPSGEDKEWTKGYQGAECLYMIVSRIHVGNSNGLEFFSENELGDVDEDGMPEILDAWGRPIDFLRWPAGFLSPLQDGIAANGRDAFDLLNVYPENFALYPLIFSAGPDGEYDITTQDRYVEDEFHNNESDPPNDPYVVLPNLRIRFGTPHAGPNRVLENLDNIHNHAISVN